MITVTRQFEFCYAHHLAGHEKCGQVHGHNAIVEVECQSSTKTYHMTDFQQLKDQVKPILDELDHADLNAVLPLVWQPPTSENICAYIAESIQKDTFLLLERVRVWETSECYAEWRANKNEDC